MLRHSPLAVADSELADAVLERTEGWAAGIRLAMIALERGVAPQRILTGQDAAHGMVAELLIAEALQQQPADVRTFLRQTSVARVLDAPLCRALTGRDDSRAVLEQLARDQVFVARLEGDREQYRYHPLFADVLRLEATRRSAPTPSASSTTAGRVVAGVDPVTTTAPVEYAVAGGCYEAAFTLIVDHLAELNAAGHRQAIARWAPRPAGRVRG